MMERTALELVIWNLAIVPAIVVTVLILLARAFRD
jgi:hypothetical protein